MQHSFKSCKAFVVQAVLKPFLVACSTKSPKLANTSVASLQKLLTRHNLGGNGLPIVIKVLEQASMNGTCHL